MSISFLPITSRLQGKIFRTSQNGLSKGSGRILSDSTLRRSEPAVRLPDDVDRIVGYQHQTDKDTELSRINGSISNHLPTILYSLSNARIFDGVVYSKQRYQVIANATKRRSVVIGNFPELDSALLCTSNVIDQYFGHWLVDGLLLETLGGQLGLPALTVSNKRWQHEAGYRELLEIFDNNMQNVIIKNLYIADDRGLNDSWISRALELRSRLSSKISSHDDNDTAVFMCRGISGVTRNLINEAELSDALGLRGFQKLTPESCDPIKIAKVLSKANIIVTVEGSAQDHALLAARPGAFIITIMPPDRMNSFAKTRADALGINWAFTVADFVSDGVFYQPLDRLLRLIDMAVNKPVYPYKST